MTRPVSVCFHGQQVCPYCGTETVAPWRRTLHRLLSRPCCPVCRRKVRRHQPCARCLTAGHIAPTLFDEGAA